MAPTSKDNLNKLAAKLNRDLDRSVYFGDNRGNVNIGHLYLLANCFNRFQLMEVATHKGEARNWTENMDAEHMHLYLQGVLDGIELKSKGIGAAPWGQRRLGIYE